MISFAFQRKEALARIGGFKKVLRKHLVKLLTRPNDLNKNHWIIEIQEYIDSMCDFSLKKGTSLNYKSIYENIVGKKNVNLENSVRNIIDKLIPEYQLNEKYLNNKNLSEEADKLYAFYEKLALAIEKHFIDKSEINAEDLLKQAQII